MTNPKPISPPDDQHALALRWLESIDLAQIIADEAVIQVTSDRVYLTIGQVQVHAAHLTKPVDSLDVTPVSRLVYTIPAFQKLVATLTSVADQIKTNPNIGR